MSSSCHWFVNQTVYKMMKIEYSEMTLVAFIKWGAFRRSGAHQLSAGAS